MSKIKRKFHRAVYEAPGFILLLHDRELSMIVTVTCARLCYDS